MENSIKTALDSVAQAFGFSNALHALSALSRVYDEHSNDILYMGAIKFVYQVLSDDEFSTMMLFVSDLSIDVGGGITFYSLAPQLGPNYNEHFEIMLKIGLSIKTPQEFMDYIKYPERFGVPVHREHHSITVFSTSMSGVVNYIRNDKRDTVTIVNPDSFTPVLEKAVAKPDQEKPASVVTTLTPRPKK